MSCPKCEPAPRSRRWLWWLGVALLLSGAAYLDHASRTAPASPGTASNGTPAANP